MRYKAAGDTAYGKAKNERRTRRGGASHEPCERGAEDAADRRAGLGPYCCWPSVCSKSPSWISRSAMESGFSCKPGSTSGPT
ncbi:hypothetical protein HMPREF9336_04262 [Segniliparus rugosus ATCC BAA-974]|uniref:Uncharacterized protein n=1 Tax=Segniliparus rugosus (strain ATCC BAA-974 / DSM 45345 / CCUG 50838 / CIP 108380 / JCM 13579 / CDC 945) TaxID=679197 RepID=U1N8B9_SEGRC|nr:hypothetical protein HMPREF9336_04262 [Segniliparus rugosus ATCC BAA-974]